MWYPTVSDSGGSAMSADGRDAGPSGTEGATSAEKLAREIRRRRKLADLSQERLASLLGFTRQYLGAIENPNRGVASADVVAAIDAKLDANGALVALQAVAQAERRARRRSRSEGSSGATALASTTVVAVTPAVQVETAMPLDPYDELNCSGRLDTTVRVLAQLSGWEMDRRQFLTNAAFAAASFAEPALFALTAQPDERIARTVGARVGMTDVEIAIDNIAHLRKLDHRYGSGRIRRQVVQLLNSTAGLLASGSYSERVGKALVGAVGQATWLAGSMASDISNYSLAQRYYVQTLNLAVSAGDRRYAANVLSHMSRLVVQRGHAARSDEERIRHARQAVSLARAGKMIAQNSTTPVLAALLDAVEARGHALTGEPRATREAVLRAERHYGQARLGDEPHWLSFYTEAELAADLGRCLRDAGEPTEATQLIARALGSYEPWRVRSRCFVQTDLAAAHLVRGDHEHAAALGHDAVSTAMQVSSDRVRDRLGTLQWQLRGLGSDSRSTRELDGRISELLTRAPSDNEGDPTR